MVLPVVHSSNSKGILRGSSGDPQEILSSVTPAYSLKWGSIVVMIFYLLVKNVTFQLRRASPKTAGLRGHCIERAARMEAIHKG